MDSEKSAKSGSVNNKEGIKVVKDGPYLVSGSIPLRKEIVVSDAGGTPVKWELGEKYADKETYVLCRCGQSKDKPYCDGSHIKAGFDGTETAGRGKYLDNAEKIEGPGLVMTDAEPICAVALFCHRDGDAWTLTKNSDNPKSKETALEEIHDCPSGRLVAWDKKTGSLIEPYFNHSIGLVEDPSKKFSGPLWVRGGVQVESSEGFKYEIRNRITLCRCGKSSNKPFCNGNHVKINFKDGDKSVE